VDLILFVALFVSLRTILSRVRNRWTGFFFDCCLFEGLIFLVLIHCYAPTTPSLPFLGVVKITATNASYGSSGFIALFGYFFTALLLGGRSGRAEGGITSY
jgi:hypothetical protein